MKRTHFPLRILFLLLALSLPAARAQNPSPAATPPGPRILRDLPYVPDAAPRQHLDLYLPQKPGAPRPLVAYIHGGGWSGGSKNGCNAGPSSLSVTPWPASSIASARMPSIPPRIQDCKAAIRWLRAHSAEYGIDPKRVGVWGESAGGHLVALLGVTGQIKDFDTGPNLDQSSAVQAVVDFFGPADFILYGNHPPVTGEDPHSLASRLLGGTISTHQAQARSASPVYFVTRDAAPFLIFHGDKDPLVPLQQSQELNAALQKAGVDSTLQVVPGGGHGGRGFDTPEVRKLISDFFGRYLKP